MQTRALLVLSILSSTLACAGDRREDDSGGDAVFPAHMLDPFVVKLGESRVVLFPRKENLENLPSYDPSAFEADCRRAIEAALAEDPSPNVAGLSFYTFRIRTSNGEHREVDFRIGDYADVRIEPIR